MKRLHREKELNQVQILRKENEKLKREVNYLRKQLTRYKNDIELVEENKYSGSTFENLKEEQNRELENLKKYWKCKVCKESYLIIIRYNKLEEDWYYRSCQKCNNRTRGKRFNKEVKGLYE